MARTSPLTSAAAHDTFRNGRACSIQMQATGVQLALRAESHLETDGIVGHVSIPCNKESGSSRQKAAKATHIQNSTVRSDGSYSQGKVPMLVHACRDPISLTLLHGDQLDH
jgi:hypothetical protein